MKILVSGGSRSGKTRFALDRAMALNPRRVYLATAEPLDEEMAQRIDRHRAERDATWTTIEEPLDIAPRLQQPGVVLVDCLTLWLSNLIFAGREPQAEVARLVQALPAVHNPVVFVTNEVGMGIVPENSLARRFRDEAGWMGQRLAEAADEVHLCALGLSLRLK
jgi:adenosylcobinamide kinase/adenosylcobinamide-phosphate guanylyltransferase